MNAYEKARAAFDAYAGMDTPNLPSDPGSALQVFLCRWTREKVKHKLPYEVEQILGVSEELGELAAAVGKLNHAILNHWQERRGMEDVQKLRESVADGLADMVLFALGIATAMRLDFWTLVKETSVEVTKRDWKKNPLNAHEVKDG